MEEGSHRGCTDILVIVFSSIGMNPQTLQRIAFGCLGASCALFALRSKGETFVGQWRLGAHPFLVLNNGDLVSVQHTFSSASGVKV